MEKGVALITGASRGIGRGIALALAQEGYTIAGLATCPDPGNTETGLYAVKRAVEQYGVTFIPLAGDISCLDAHERILQEVLSYCGRVDVLINNAGVAPAQRMDLLECRPESYDRLLNINLRGPYFFTQRVARQMIQQPRDEAGYAPKIIFITSISSRVASINRAEYCVSKAGLSMTAQCFAVALAPYGIHVYDLQPGIIATDMSSAAREKYDRLIADGLLLTPRWGTPEDVGKAVAGIVSGYLDYSTGAVIEIGGGYGVARL
ncbi:MAG TPA: 3-ketoacyl-ACP reductase [Candidatus Hydrogenedentes bacterium]|jgi:NAD(P)-dependent dehydrogenase (short-subunit alcohol dehydrogenase family)|nr:MAG: 2-dehydro-3-deoxy-D-gluconate 5-dehydrogenase [Candidatus Hydrogenedentes bacterium ADurb.Bin101]HOC68141.1 3-ketoacyl-ACP reductase [Candidatus Hydrogenedentota bacterium]HQN02278.1 3-ketoacyl-ACP reductase [Candidatus Hydrogenedentota bacterium]